MYNTLKYEIDRDKQISIILVNLNNIYSYNKQIEDQCIPTYIIQRYHRNIHGSNRRNLRLAIAHTAAHFHRFVACICGDESPSQLTYLSVSDFLHKLSIERQYYDKK